MDTLDRRGFLKAVPVAVGAAALVRRTPQTPPTSAPVIGAAAYTPRPDYPIQPIRYDRVTLTDAFWKPKVARNAEVTIPFEVEKLLAKKALTGNVLEAAILSLKTHPDAHLQAQIEARIQEILKEPSRGNSGFEVAATCFAVTRRRELLDRAINTASAIYDDFQTRNPPFNGGERDAINCVQLYRATHDRKHLDLAKHYLDIRGLPNSVNRSRHNQSYKPVLEQTEAVGHAVNAVTLMVSLTDVGVLTGLHEYLDTARRLWLDVVNTKLYVTGGVGATGNEGFGEAYALPNLSAYAETCAVLMFMTLNHRLFMATGEAQFIDVLERGMYNNALSGVAASGHQFFYVNRLASAGDGRDTRWEHASLECCPPNLVRFLAGMPGLIYAQDQQGAIYVNLYVSSRTSCAVGGRELGLSVESEMPWGGRSTIAVSAKAAVPARLKLRMPGWTRNRPTPSRLYTYAETDASTGSGETRPEVLVNGRALTAEVDAMGYVTIDRTWKQGDAVEVRFPMPVRTVRADARVLPDRGRIAVERGPIVYCAEWPEVADKRVSNLVVEGSASAAKTAFEADFYGGATLLETSARTLSAPDAPAAPLRLIPYHLWANRGAGEMTVWLLTRPYALGDVGPAGGYIFYENPNYAADGWRYLEAAPFDQSAGAKWGCFRHAIAGARGTAVGTGKQNTLDMLAACTEPGSAADLCAGLSVNGVRGWFLPSRDELALMYRHLRAAGLGDFRDGGSPDNFSYWASSQQTADMAAHIDFADAGRQHSDDKDFPRRVRAIRAI